VYGVVHFRFLHAISLSLFPSTPIFDIMNSTAPSETAVEPSPERKQSVDEEKAALDLDLDLPPDGGKRAWLVVLAVCVRIACSSSNSNAIFDFQIWGLTVAEGGYLIAWGVCSTPSRLPSIWLIQLDVSSILRVQHPSR